MFPKSYHTNGLQAKQILSVKNQNKYIFDLGRGFCDSFSMLFPEAPDSCGKKNWNDFCCIVLPFAWTQKVCLRF